jgi:hypothetical protein
MGCKDDGGRVRRRDLCVLVCVAHLCLLACQRMKSEARSTMPAHLQVVDRHVRTKRLISPLPHRLHMFPGAP